MFKDSLRLFSNTSLEELCKLFEVEGKFMKYDKSFNKIGSEYSDNLRKDSVQDRKCVYNVLIKAQKRYHDKYTVDIANEYSTSSLSLKIFKTHFMKENDFINTLTSKQDDFIRKSYLGGATDYYKLRIENASYYDINSLYPARI